MDERDVAGAVYTIAMTPMRRTYAGPSRSQQAWNRSKKSRGEYARERREALLIVLSIRDAEDPRPVAGQVQCKLCKENVLLAHAHVDHVDGRTWELRSLSRWSRVARYWREHEQGVRLRVLCATCNHSTANAWRGANRRY